MVSLTAYLASDALSASRKQKNHWRIANRLAELLEVNVSFCRQAATSLIKEDNYHTLFSDHITAKKAAREAMRNASKNFIKTDVNTNLPTVSETVVEDNEYPFDTSLVQKVAELSKEHGYDNVLAALKLYNKLVKGL